ncbi:uncharacterized protein ACLA_067440 [Aspergillus clavatus NRRL 1]|uniref:TauD/TfdA-like domain-containing protein n=1 Tax=Aspergillus clavatus (strain ATCC 1007 / CBS 513.65 / DSM 816 / NCTC 3887 / NRRL 1 / QM 1276 / 107) TaxID=344612 RepID=A1CGM6_ASPCL|nr:uncharacterized protein ACLA_067440 [Aspergillus clavatus NRRL 1]EAW11106.1 conserved hypothetical protein [Aspergillus clavatus NRRL 1]
MHHLLSRPGSSAIRFIAHPRSFLLSNLRAASDPNHFGQVHHLLRNTGLVRLQLSFSDNESAYLQNLLQKLHKHHGHGLPITHSAQRGWMWDIRPSPDSFQSHHCQARSETMEEFPWHTDCSYERCPPRYFALQVLQPDRCGGGTLSVLNADRLLSLLSPGARKWLSSPSFRITVPPEFTKDEGERSIRGSLLAIHRSGPRLRFREDIISPLHPAAEGALMELKSVLLDPSAQAQVVNLTAHDLPQGSIILMDNGRWLHARNEVKDPQRHLRRVRWDAKPFLAQNVAVL